MFRGEVLKQEKLPKSWPDVRVTTMRSEGTTFSVVEKLLTWLGVHGVVFLEVE